MEARWILAHALQVDDKTLAAELFKPVPADAAEVARAMLGLRLSGYPLQLLLGETEFFGLKLKVKKGVLIPRPETEGLVERALICTEGQHQPRVLDVGTGPGFFAIILAELGYQVTAVDYTASMLEEARRNAGALAGCIRFRQMNAEELTFPADSFDVVVTRNVTWNLRDPERAYGQWSRVLKPGGVLLNFDANWYRYLWDRGAEQAHARDRENLWASDVRDETAGTDVSAMEAIARQAPLSARMRPGWDLGVLRGLGLQAAADTEIWRQVWTREERINNASTPMFLVEARKCPLPQ